MAESDDLSCQGATTAELLAEALHEWGIRSVFGRPGVGLVQAFERLGLPLTQARHEEAAALMATAWAQLTHQVGVCLAAGPGSSRLLAGLAEAARGRHPVLAITEDVPEGFHTPATWMLEQPDKSCCAVSNGLRTATVRRSVVHLALPPGRHTVKKAKPAGKKLIPQPDLCPSEDDLSDAVNLLDSADQPVIVAGEGARGAEEALLRLSERLKAPIVTLPRAKDVVADHHLYNLGALGPAGTRPAVEAVEEADLLILAGTTHIDPEFFPDPSGVRVIQIHPDAQVIGQHYRLDAGLCGDPAQVLAWLTYRAQERRDRTFLRGKQEALARWRHQLDHHLAQSAPSGTHFIRLLADEELGDTVLVVDGGRLVPLITRYWHTRSRQRILFGGVTGHGLPYTIAATQALPDRRIVGLLSGEGLASFVGELGTLADLAPRVTLIVMGGGQAQQWAEIMKAYGLTAAYVPTLEAFDLALAESHDAEGPYGITVPFEADSPSPPKTSPSQLASYAVTLWRDMLERNQHPKR